MTLSHYETPYHLTKTYDGWCSRKMIGFFKRYVNTVMERYKGKVHYWLTVTIHSREMKGHGKNTMLESVF